MDYIATQIPPGKSQYVLFEDVFPTETWEVRSLEGERFLGLAAKIRGLWMVICPGGFCPVRFESLNPAIEYAAKIGGLEILLEGTAQNYPSEEGLN